MEVKAMLWIQKYAVILGKIMVPRQSESYVLHKPCEFLLKFDSVTTFPFLNFAYYLRNKYVKLKTSSSMFSG